MYFSGLMVSNLEYNFGGPRSVFEGADKKFAFHSDIKNFLLKTNGGETERVILL